MAAFRPPVVLEGMYHWTGFDGFPGRRLWLAVLAALACGVLSSRASSIHYAWELPNSYANTGSTYPAQAAPGTTTSFYASAPQREWTQWWLTPERWKYQWFRDGRPISGETRWSLTLRNLTAADTGNYSVRWSSDGYPEFWDYFALTVAPQPATPLISSVTVPVFARTPLKLFPNGRLVLWDYPLDGQSYSMRFHIVSPAGALEQTVVRGDPSYESNINFLSDGRFLRSNDKVPGLSDLLGTTDFFIQVLEEYPDGSCLIRAERVMRTWVTDPKPVMLRLTHEFFIDYSYPPVFGVPSVAKGQWHAGHFLAWEGPTLVARFADGSLDPAFHLFRMTDAWPDGSAEEIPFYGRYLEPLQDGTLLLRAGDYFVRLRADGTPIDGTRGSTPHALAARVSPFDGHLYYGNRRFRTSTPIGEETFFVGTEPTTGARWEWILPKADGTLLAGTTSPGGHILGTLRADAVATPTFPVIGTAPVPALERGASLSLAPPVSGPGPFTYQWVSLDGGELPAITNAPSLVFESFSARNVGHYQLRVTNAQGTTLSPVFRLVPFTVVRLAALSGRGVAGTTENALVAGWRTHRPASFLTRGVGPALAQYGVTRFAPNPALEIFDAFRSAYRNDDWDSDSASGVQLKDLFRETGAPPFLDGSKDAAVRSANNDLATLHVTSPERQGVALAEVFDLNSPSAFITRLTALSLRGFAGTGDETLIGGFVIDDRSGLERPLPVLLRVVGPTLAQYGITQPLADPVLKLFNARGELIASNDNWDDTADNRTRVAAATERVKLTPLPAAGGDAALVAELPPGSYTIHATNRNGATGVALIEIYRADLSAP